MNEGAGPRVKVTVNGPYLVTGGLSLGTDIIVSSRFGFGLRWEKGPDFPPRATYSLCRCGRSLTPPYCDGAHRTTAWDGTETAALDGHAKEAEVMTGPGLTLVDIRILCAGARFCNRSGGTWNLTKKSDN